jgi:hypothetical protein
MVVMIMKNEQTKCLKGLHKAVPHAVVIPHTLFVSDGKVRGVARYACDATAPFEMTIAEFEQLEFENFEQTG